MVGVWLPMEANPVARSTEVRILQLDTAVLMDVRRNSDRMYVRLGLLGEAGARALELSFAESSKRDCSIECLPTSDAMGIFFPETATMGAQ